MSAKIGATIVTEHARFTSTVHIRNEHVSVSLVRDNVSGVNVSSGLYAIGDEERVALVESLRWLENAVEQHTAADREVWRRLVDGLPFGLALSDPETLAEVLG